MVKIFNILIMFEIQYIDRKCFVIVGKNSELRKTSLVLDISNSIYSSELILFIGYFS